MEIKITDGVSWQTEPGAQQSEAAREWLRTKIYGRLAMNTGETDRVIPTVDRWGRPLEWVVEGVTWRATVKARVCGRAAAHMGEEARHRDRRGERG